MEGDGGGKQGRGGECGDGGRIERAKEGEREEGKQTHHPAHIPHRVSRHRTQVMQTAEIVIRPVEIRREFLQPHGEIGHRCYMAVGAFGKGRRAEEAVFGGVARVPVWVVREGVEVGCCDGEGEERAQMKEEGGYPKHARNRITEGYEDMPGCSLR